MEATWLETDYAKAIPKDIRLMVLPYIRLPNYERYCRYYGQHCYVCWERTRRWVCIQATQDNRRWLPTCLECRFPTASEVVFFGQIPPVQDNDRVVYPIPGRTNRVMKAVRAAYGLVGIFDE